MMEDEWCMYLVLGSLLGCLSPLGDDLVWKSGVVEHVAERDRDLSLSVHLLVFLESSRVAGFGTL